MIKIWSSWLCLQENITSRMLNTRGVVLPYKGLMGTCGQPGYVFRDFCIEFIIFCLKQDKCLRLGIKNRNSVLNRVGKSAIFVLNRVRVWGAAPHLPTQGYIELPPPGLNNWFSSNSLGWETKILIHTTWLMAGM